MNEISQFLVGHGGAVLFAVVFVEQAGLPIPSAPWLLAAGALSAEGSLNVVPAISMAALACVAADTMWFYIGRRGGNRVLSFFCRLSLARNSCVERSKGLFARRGLQWLVAAKFLPGLGAVMPPLAGALGVSAGRFLVLDSVGSLCYAAFYIFAGFIFRNQLQQLMAILSELGFSALLLALVSMAAYIALKYARRQRFLFARTKKKVADGEAIVTAMKNRVFDNRGVAQQAELQPANNVAAVGFLELGLVLTNGASPQAQAEVSSSVIVLPRSPL